MKYLLLPDHHPTSNVLWMGTLAWIVIILLSVFLLAVVGMIFLKYMRQIVAAGDLNYDGEDKNNVPLTRRILARTIPPLRIIHSKAIALWYGNPSAKLKLVGVTGTNGKTTIATVLYDLFRKMGHRCGLISTVCIKIEDEEYPAIITTPGAVDLNRLLSKMVKAGCEYVFMECSSHGLVQKRINGLYFSGGIFTNLTRDHLDYHRTFDNYRNAKKSFFDFLSPLAFSIVNADDNHWQTMVQDCKAKIKTYSIHDKADFMAKVQECDLEGMCLDINGREVDVHFIGKFNASNLLAIYGTAVMLGKEPQKILTALSAMRSVRGRLEPMRSPEGFITLIDYAHTPDALRNVLETIHEVLNGKGRIITVCGAGGNRDIGKRPLMAQEAVRWSDIVIFTSDNPRFEDPQTIINDMMSGVDTPEKDKVFSIVDRREAIIKACSMAQKDDVVLVAGKGHEDYQEIKDRKYPFSDKEVISEYLRVRDEK